MSGIDGCAKCVCATESVKCDLVKCQDIIQGKEKPNMVASSPNYNDYTNIKDQIANQYFAEYSADRLKAITTALGCNSTDCPQLIAQTDIKYSLLDSVGKDFIGRGEKISKIVIHSTDLEAENRSPSQQVITSIAYNLTLRSFYEVVVSKTWQVHSGIGVDLLVYKAKAEITFTNEKVEKFTQANETNLFYASQHIAIDPFTKMDTTFNFFQYDDINNYLLHFQIADNSTLTHPELDANSNIVNVTKSLGDFMSNHINFLSTLKYRSDSDLKIVENEGKFILKNFPATEKLTNYGVDVSYSRAVKINS